MSKLKKALQKAKKKRSGLEKELTTIDRQYEESKKKKESLEVANSSETAFENDNYIENTKIVYTKTKVKSVDPDILKKNKIVSLFHDHDMTDQINLLRAQLISKLKLIGGNSILITSANPGEGKTFTSINLAISIAKELDKTVLVIDADLKNPSVHHYDFASDFFGVDINVGLADYLLGRHELSELLINPGIEKLTILPAGRSMPNSSELLGSPRMEKLIKEVRSKYKDRIILIDCSSILASPDPIVFSHHVDGILIVVESERTTPAQLKKAMGLLNGRQVIGAVMNKNRDKR